MAIGTTNKVVILLFLLSAYISGQWARFALAYLSGVAIDGCKQVCTDQTLPLCEGHPGSSSSCDDCYANHSASKYNLKQGTCLNDREYSFLVSYGFIAFFATCGLFAGRIADRGNRKNIVAFAALGWTFGTLVQAISHNFTTLLVARVLMGLFTSFSAPASYSILADTFDKDSLATANGVYALGVYLGGGLSSLSIVIAHSFGWRAGSLVVTCLSLVSSILCFLIGEPTRKSFLEDENKRPKPVTLLEALKTTFADHVVVVAIIAASTRFLGGFALGAYLPQFYKRKFPEYNSEYSIINAFVVSVAGGISSVAGGRLADVMEVKYGSYACGLIPVVGSVIGVFPMLGALQVNDFYASIFLVLVSYLFVECWFGPALKMIVTRIPKETRALAISIYLFSGSMIGNISPIAIGWLDDGSTVHSLVDLLSTILIISYIGCAILFSIAVFLIKRSAQYSLVPNPSAQSPSETETEDNLTVPLTNGREDVATSNRPSIDARTTAALRGELLDSE